MLQLVGAGQLKRPQEESMAYFEVAWCRRPHGCCRMHGRWVFARHAHTHTAALHTDNNNLHYTGDCTPAWHYAVLTRLLLNASTAACGLPVLRHALASVTQASAHCTATVQHSSAAHLQQYDMQLHDEPLKASDKSPHSTVPPAHTPARNKHAG